MKTYGAVEIELQAFLTSAPNRDEQLHAQVALPPGRIGEEAGWAPETIWPLW